MARIPESEVERLKKEISVQRLVEASGIKLTRHGADLLGLCPFHDDRNPSLVVTPTKTSGTAWALAAQAVCSGLHLKSVRTAFNAISGQN